MADSTTSLTASLPLKEAYDDLLHPTMKAVGETVSLAPRIINVVLNPLRKWITQKEYNFEQTSKLLAEKLKDAAPEKIVPAEPYVAVPALQNLSYCMDSDELRNLYANLLANAILADRKDSVHPAFVDCIRQMNPLDARILENFFSRNTIPLCDIKKAGEPVQLSPIESLINFKRSANGSILILENTADVPGITESLESISVSVTNLIRFGFLSVPDDSYYIKNEVYSSLDSSEKIRSYLLHLHPFIGPFYLERKMGTITSFGKAFCEMCIKDPSA